MKQRVRNIEVVKPWGAGLRLGKSRRDSRTKGWTVVLLFWSMLFGWGCGGDEASTKADDADQVAEQPAQDPKTWRARSGTPAPQGFTATSEDIDRDGQPDQWTYQLTGGQVQRIERDLNFDGQVDVWQYPNTAGAIVEEEMDLDLDGSIDVVTYYDGNTISRKEMALGFKGVFTIVKFYDKRGELLRIERDTNADGRPDIWEYYQDSRRVRIGWDRDGDGLPDTFDQLS